MGLILTGGVYFDHNWLVPKVRIGTQDQRLILCSLQVNLAIV